MRTQKVQRFLQSLHSHLTQGSEMKENFTLKVKKAAIWLGVVCSLAISGCSSNTPSTTTDYKAAALGANLTPAQKASYNEQTEKALSGQSSAMLSPKPAPSTPPPSSP